MKHAPQTIKTPPQAGHPPAGDRAETTSRCPTVLFLKGRLATVMDTLPLERPLRVHLNGRLVGETMRTPGADKDLAVGMALTSGAAGGFEDADLVQFHEQEHEIYIFANILPPLRNGGERQALPSPPSSMAMEDLTALLMEMRGLLEARQRMFKRTGATHSAMLFDASGGPLSGGEDVGRHNAFDKAVGQALRQDGLGKAAFALVTSRLSHEIAIKALRAGIPVLAGFSAATSLAVDMARENGMTLVSRLRPDSMNVYT